MWNFFFAATTTNSNGNGREGKRSKREAGEVVWGLGLGKHNINMAFVVRGHCLRQATQQRQGNKNNASKQQHENLNNNSNKKQQRDEAIALLRGWGVGRQAKARKSRLHSNT